MHVFRSAVLVATVATIAGAQAAKAPAKAPTKAAAAPKAIRVPAAAVGTWDGKSMMGPKDSVVTTYVMTLTADGKGSTMVLPKRDPIPARVLAVGGDSVVTEAGPYNSVLRPGVQVTTRTTAHFKDGVMNGSTEAHYSNGDVVKLKMTAKKKA